MNCHRGAYANLLPMQCAIVPTCRLEKFRLPFMTTGWRLPRQACSTGSRPLRKFGMDNQDCEIEGLPKHLPTCTSSRHGEAVCPEYSAKQRNMGLESQNCWIYTAISGSTCFESPAVHLSMTG